MPSESEKWQVHPPPWPGYHFQTQQGDESIMEAAYSRKSCYIPQLRGIQLWLETAGMVGLISGSESVVSSLRWVINIKTCAFNTVDSMRFHVPECRTSHTCQ